MTLGQAIAMATLSGSVVCGCAARAADVSDHGRLARRNVVVVPDCAQNRLPVGLRCIPRVGLTYPDPALQSQVVDLDKAAVVRPYPFIFNWGP